MLIKHVNEICEQKSLKSILEMQAHEIIMCNRRKKKLHSMQNCSGYCYFFTEFFLE